MLNHIKLASSRGQSSTIIAAKKLTSLSTTLSGKHEAERKRTRDDHVVLDDEYEPGDVERDIVEKNSGSILVVEGDSQSTPQNISKTKVLSPDSSLAPLRSRFESCKEFLRQAYINHPPPPPPPPPSSANNNAKTKRSGIPCSKSASNIHQFTLEDKGCLTSEVKCGVGEGGDQCIRTSFKKQGTYYHNHNIIEEQLDEVEIVSLLEEKVPKYKLRADCITKFGGCENEDFVGIPYPALRDFSPVTKEQAYLTLGYFLLSGDRVSQMTKTFADVDALQRLLEEKEKDLELAARIGQQLLEQNRDLEERVNAYEIESRENQDTITQLRHDLIFKTQLLEIYNDSCNSEESSKAGTPVGSVASVLERRLTSLEEENKSLRSEACRIAEDVEKTEAEEKYLVEDAIKRLGETNSRVTIISDELQRKTEESIRQQEEILTLVDEIKGLQEINKELLQDNANLSKALESLQSCQSELTTELGDLKDNYVEIVAILKETQEQLKEAQKQRDSGVDVVSVFDSLAYEIESSVARQRRASDYFRRTFDTVRCANSSKYQDSTSALMSSASSLGYHSHTGSSCLSSLESSMDVSNMSLVHANPCRSMTIAGSDLSSSSICPSPNGSTPSDKYGWRLPEKLQIVKPLEGSSTLQVWTALATPHLGNLLDQRPGVHTKTERPMAEIGMQNILSLTAPETTTLPNIVSTPTVFTFVTTSTTWDRRDSTTTVYSSDLSTLSTCSLASSLRADSPTPSACSSVSVVSSNSNNNGNVLSTNNAGGEFGTVEHHLYLKCDTPQNSPMDGNSRPSTPTNTHRDAATIETNNRTFKTLFSVYDTLCGTLSGLGGQSSGEFLELKPKKYDLMSKIGSFVDECSRSSFQAPPKSCGMDAVEDIFNRF